MSVISIRRPVSTIEFSRFSGFSSFFETFCKVFTVKKEQGKEERKSTKGIVLDPLSMSRLELSVVEVGGR